MSNSLSIDCRLCGGEHQRADDGALIDRCQQREESVTLLTLRARVKNLAAIIVGLSNEKTHWKECSRNHRKNFLEQHERNRLLRIENAILKRRLYKLEHSHETPWLIGKIVSLLGVRRG